MKFRTIGAIIGFVAGILIAIPVGGVGGAIVLGVIGAVIGWLAGRGLMEYDVGEVALAVAPWRLTTCW